MCAKCRCCKAFVIWNIASKFGEINILWIWSTVTQNVFTSWEDKRRRFASQNRRYTWNVNKMARLEKACNFELSSEWNILSTSNELWYSLCVSQIWNVTGASRNSTAPTVIHFGSSVVSRSAYYWGYQVKALFLIFASSTSIAIYCLPLSVTIFSCKHSADCIKWPLPEHDWRLSVGGFGSVSREESRRRFIRLINKLLPHTAELTSRVCCVQLQRNFMHFFVPYKSTFQNTTVICTYRRTFTFRNSASCAHSTLIFSPYYSYSQHRLFPYTELTGWRL
jgi:hypothetical protein